MRNFKSPRDFVQGGASWAYRKSVRHLMPLREAVLYAGVEIDVDRRAGDGFLIPRYALTKSCYFKAQRRVLSLHTQCLQEDSEIKRIERYWREWNKIIESAINRSQTKYLQVKIEEVEGNLQTLMDFHEIDSSNVKIPTDRNRKGSATRKPPQSALELTVETQDLARKYGYNMQASQG